MRVFFKQLYRYTHRRSYRHNENIWPYFKITRSETGEISKLTYRKKSIAITTLSDLKDYYCGTVLLLATGPSIKDIDTSLIPKNMHVMGVNGAYHLADKVNFSLYTIVDMAFFDNNISLVESIVFDKKITLFTTIHGMKRIFDRYGINVHCKLALIEDALFKTYEEKTTPEKYRGMENIYFNDSFKDIVFSSDIRKGIFDAGTVSYWSLQILPFIGFNEILIAGLDMNNFEKPRFYENNDNKAPSYLSNKLFDIIIPAMSLAESILDKKNISIINLSSISSIPDSIFKKYDFNYYLKNRG